MINRLFVKYKVIISYLFWGVVTTFVNISIFMIWLHIGGNYQIGNVVAWFSSVIVAFLTNKVWVFNSNFENWSGTISEVISFFLARVGTLLIEILITWVGITLLGGPPLLVKLVDNVFVVVINYVLSKVFVFS